MKTIKRIFPALLALGLILACAKPPVDEMNKASDAVTRAENDPDAVSYAGGALTRARDALSRMQSEAEAKRYDAAKNYAAEAVTNAEKAIADGKTGAARAREEAANLINSLSGPLGETADALNAARQVRNIKLDFDALSADMEAARSAYNSAQQSLQAGNYPSALSGGQNVRSLLAGVNARITEAAAAVSRKQ
jgi:hypothetical protein